MRSCQLQFYVTNGDERAFVDIVWFGYSDIENAKEAERGYVAVEDNRSVNAPRIQKRSIEGFGDEAALWFLKDTNEWANLLFRRAKTCVAVGSSYEQLARPLSQLIDQELKKE